MKNRAYNILLVENTHYKLAVFIILIGCLLFISNIVIIGPDFRVSMYMERDLVRSLMFFDQFPVAGSEMSKTNIFGKNIRTPGWGYYFVLNTLQNMTTSYLQIYYTVLAMLVSSFVLLYFSLRPFISEVGAIMAVFLMASSPVADAIFVNFWNPTFSIIFTIFSVSFLFY